MSKKRSGTSRRPEVIPVIYLDENIPRGIAEELRKYDEWKVVVHRDRFPHDPDGDSSVDDTTVIRTCGESGWILISSDDKMRIVPDNCKAAARYGTRVFLFARTYRTGEYLAALVAGRMKLLRFA